MKTKRMVVPSSLYVSSSFGACAPTTIVEEKDTTKNITKIADDKNKISFSVSPN